jgi:multicomponent Na+:H+ antiporter subunit G
MRATIAWVLLGAGGAVELLGVLGVVLLRDALDRLHYVGAGAVGVPLVCLAVIVGEGPSVIGLKALLTAGFLLVTAPVLAHATARAIHLHREARR